MNDVTMNLEYFLYCYRNSLATGLLPEDATVSDISSNLKGAMASGYQKYAGITR
jgi:hypothetical protein